MYKALRPLLFHLDPESAHDRAMALLEWTARHPGALRLVRAACALDDERLQTRAFGLRFPNPIGLAAGFDKNAVAVPTWAALGFGFVEVGSVTAHAQPGNPKPRLFRLPEDAALVNRMGFNNAGAAAVAARLAALRASGAIQVPLGVNLGKSRVTPLDDAPGDYVQSLGALWPHADYFAVNVSSPNTPGLRALQEAARLDELLGAVTAFAAAQPVQKPILLKLAPDLSEAELAEAAERAARYGLAGLIATNTTVSREGLRTPLDEAGGLSGKPLRARSLAVLRFLQGLGTGLPLVSVGGVASVDDVYERLAAGASLVQLYTGLVYEGPLLLKRLHRGLLRRLEHEGLASVEELARRHAPPPGF
ncbi:quinone-dependent dihydroorotate dehydrogenase [Truepera radiovictrix]|uniref:Dihydroorotate dehydrogenase (quinone) n=1 Tax=Truepera radiovictrix (strain DSM 17093 / CIP 108686 / LMG 22925 / RQ-24) TaxID=649638 RepID=D7CUX9_TRURR|nr:quinone-dependent dihydroorotate dehydrogenase [Truepera radiovictrix]ADI15806.1 dihydroorotate dehydrogenase [Truepera radiovictrix DSM 17093]WMT58566.1 quinone-dependent dihydroorotate dehydrogenase [Truepera radiovictrix]